MSSALTKRIVLTSEPRDRPYELRDAQVRGLILRVQPSGHKAWIVTWAHGKRRTLGSVEHLTLDQARDQARQAVAEYVQSGLPSLAKSKPTSCTLETLLNDHFEPWAVAELKGGRQYPDRIRSVFPWLRAVRSLRLTFRRWNGGGVGVSLGRMP
ncbi:MULTISPECIES: Arm DNA-binding domain-containing protein [unclassified Stenotrophomonas]|uniref:Arm DNA-binding domain-containing protein n=1 Tax=unclassified Stenotrophomonas TaxID=196198 RepID=UPI002119332C|nr:MULTISPECIES: Arm DNA-binding domain-containing protein [unclassified Stenotrophomonas]